MKVCRRVITLLVFAFIAGCGSDNAQSPDVDTMAGETSPDIASAPNAPAEAAYAPMSVEDIERWERGMQAELQAVREAEESLRTAETSEDTLNAMMAVNDMSTRAAGARAAGVSEDRYQFVRTTLSSAVKNLSPLDEEMDVSQMPEAMIEQFEQNRQLSLEQIRDVLPDDVLEALRTRASELRRQDIALISARLEAVEGVR